MIKGNLSNGRKNVYERPEMAVCTIIPECGFAASPYPGNTKDLFEDSGNVPW